MGYLTDGITFNTLRRANELRVVQFRDKQGRIAHPGGISEWNLMEWGCAMAGEAGEACNQAKKIERGDYSDAQLPAAVEKLANELADVVIYCDLVAQRAHVNLGAAVASKFNEVSHRVESNVMIAADGVRLVGPWPREDDGDGDTDGC